MPGQHFGLRDIAIGDTVTVTFTDTVALTGVYDGFRNNFQYITLIEGTDEHFIPANNFAYITKSTP
jgi:hypothetical protein